MSDRQATRESYRAYAWQLIGEYALVYVMLRLLEADIDARRELEELRKLTYPEKHSVVVERTREEFQEDQRRLHAQIDAVFDLMWTRGENHESE